MDARHGIRPGPRNQDLRLALSALDPHEAIHTVERHNGEPAIAQLDYRVEHEVVVGDAKPRLKRERPRFKRASLAKNRDHIVVDFDDEGAADGHALIGRHPAAGPLALGVAVEGGASSRGARPRIIRAACSNPRGKAKAALALCGHNIDAPGAALDRRDSLISSLLRTREHLLVWVTGRHIASAGDSRGRGRRDAESGWEDRTAFDGARLRELRAGT